MFSIFIKHLCTPHVCKEYVGPLKHILRLQVYEGKSLLNVLIRVSVSCHLWNTFYFVHQNQSLSLELGLNPVKVSLRHNFVTKGVGKWRLICHTIIALIGWTKRRVSLVSGEIVSTRGSNSTSLRGLINGTSQRTGVSMVGEKTRNKWYATVYYRVPS